MPQRQHLLDELKRENYYGVFLAAQMGGAPNELQLVVQTAEYDAAVEGLRERTRYIIRVLGVREHKVSLGMFGLMAWFNAEEHPLLYPYNTPPVGVFFRGGVPNPTEVALDISQAHASTFGAWRPLGADLNHTAPLLDLLASGGGMLGEMSKPAAERMAKVFAHHNIEYKLLEEPSFSTVDEHGRSKLVQLLQIDDGYIIALDFSVEFLGKGPAPTDGLTAQKDV